MYHLYIKSGNTFFCIELQMTVLPNVILLCICSTLFSNILKISTYTHLCSLFKAMWLSVLLKCIIIAKNNCLLAHYESIKTSFYSFIYSLIQQIFVEYLLIVRCENTGLKARFITISLFVNLLFYCSLMMEPVNHELFVPRSK